MVPEPYQSAHGHEGYDRQHIVLSLQNAECRSAVGSMNKVQKTLYDDNPYRGIIGVLKMIDNYGLGDLVRDENAETHQQDDALSRKDPTLDGGFPGVAAFLGHGFRTLIGSHRHENV